MTESRALQFPLRRARARAGLLQAVLIMVFMLVSVRLGDLMLLGEDANTHITTADPKALRGRIYDRDGNILATTITRPSLSVNPVKIKDPKTLTYKLISIFKDYEFDALYSKLTAQKRFTWIKRHLTPQEHQSILDLGEPCLEISFEQKRIYPMGELFAHVIGFTNIDNKGLDGIEKRAEEALTNGEEKKLTLSASYQDVIRQSLLSAIERYNAEGAGGVLVDVKTGEILSLVSLPDFNPNELKKSDAKQLFNTITQGRYEPGSVFKIATAAMGLESGQFTPAHMVDVTKPFRIGKYTIKDYYPSSQPLSFTDVFVKSSNIGAARIVKAVGKDYQQAFLKRLGVFDKIKVDGLDTVSPTLPKKWRDTTSTTVSYGYGFALAPIHLLNVLAPTVNGGKKVEFFLEKKSTSEPTQCESVFTERASSVVCNILQNVVINGSARQAKVKGYLVGGKTGTTEVIANKKYDKKNNITSFVGVFPINNPRYMLYINLHKPKATKDTYGKASAGWNAAPVGGEIIQNLAPLMGLLPLRND